MAARKVSSKTGTSRLPKREIDMEKVARNAHLFEDAKRMADKVVAGNYRRYARIFENAGMSRETVRDGLIDNIPRILGAYDGNRDFGNLAYVALSNKLKNMVQKAKSYQNR